MVRDLAGLLGPFGVARASDLTGRVDRHTVSRGVAAGRLLRPHPGVVAIAACWEDWRTRALGGVLATDGTLSHTSALAVWRVLGEDDGPVHVSVPAARRALRSRGLVVHRARDLVSDRLGPFPVTPLPRALADSWGWAFGQGGGRSAVERVRGTVIGSLRGRR